MWTFSSKYREYFGENKITPKFHTLESHLIPYTERFGSLLQFSEEITESFHPIITKLENIYSHFRDEEKREFFLYKRINIKTDPDVRNTLEGHERKKRARGSRRKGKKTKKEERRAKRMERLCTIFPGILSQSRNEMISV